MAQTKTKTKRPQKKTSTLNVVLVWDMSGSMGYVRDAALEGANQYIEDLRKDKNVENMRMSITIFDTVFERWYEDLPLSEIPSIGARYQPRGMTALNDAVADAITTMDARLKGDRAEERVLIVVLTDGQENSSQEYGGIAGMQALAKLVKQRESTGKWTFIYLGAGKPQEVAAAAAQYNIPRGNTMSYAADYEGTVGTFVVASHATTALSGGMRGQTVTAMADAGHKSVDEQEDENDR